MDNNVVDCGCDNVVFVNITQSYRMLKYRSIKGRENVYECTRKYWKLNKARADKADFIVGLRMASCVVCTSLPTGKKWMEVRYCPELADDEELQQNPEYLKRFAFSGKEASPDVQQRYIGREIDFKFGMNPVKYNF